MSDEVSQIKDKIDIVSLISGYVPLKKSGRNYKGLCPFHAEKTPSFMVSPELQIFKCFGCGERGDVFSFLMRQEGLDFREALVELAQRAGVKLSSRTEEASPEVARREKIYAANSLAAQFYNYLLSRHKVGRPALEYLRQRGLKDETIQKFNLGYAPNQANLLTRFLGKKGFSVSQALEAGLILKSERSASFYDRFRGRITFPLVDAKGQVVGFSSRSLVDRADVPKYLNSPETAVFQKSQFLFGLDLAKSSIRKLGRALLVEGQMDLISNVQAGIANVVATSGSSFTLAQARILKKLAKEIVFCFDADSAGQRALERAVEMAETADLVALVVPLPEGAKDPDEAVQKYLRAWQSSLASPQSFYDYYLERETLGLLKSDALGRRRAVDKILPVLAKIGDPLEKAHFIKKLSEKLDLEERFVTEALARVKSSPLAEDRSGKAPTPDQRFSWGGWQALKGGRRLETLQKYCLVLLLRFDQKLVKKLLPKVSDLEFKDSEYLDLFRGLKKSLSSSRKDRPELPLRSLEGLGPAQLLEELLLFDLGPLETEINLQEKEIEVVLKELKRESLKREALEIQGQIRLLEAAGQAKLLTELGLALRQNYQRLKDLEAERPMSLRAG